MCYSETLKSDLGAYKTDYGWVLVGVKAMVKVNQSPGYYCALKRFDPDALRFFNRMPSSGAPITNDTLSRLDNFGNYVYAFDVPMRDEHGFHLGASRRGALKAALNFFERPRHTWPRKCIDCRQSAQAWSYLDPWFDVPCMHVKVTTRAAQVRQEWGKRLVTTRVLVPEIAVEHNHAHVATFIRPGQHETESQIADVALAGDRWRHKERYELELQRRVKAAEEQKLHELMIQELSKPLFIPTVKLDKAFGPLPVPTPVPEVK